MTSLRSISAAAGLLLAVALSPQPARAIDPTGTWLSEDGDAKVRVTDCGGALCGTIVWLKELIDPKTGRPRTDKFNPDVSKRNRPLIGLQVVNGLKPSGPDRWSGPIYHADEGWTINVDLRMENPKQAKLQGCLLRIICKSERWTRVD